MVLKNVLSCLTAVVNINYYAFLVGATHNVWKRFENEES